MLVLESTSLTELLSISIHGSLHTGSVLFGASSFVSLFNSADGFYRKTHHELYLELGESAASS